MSPSQKMFTIYIRITRHKQFRRDKLWWTIHLENVTKDQQTVFNY